jgi:hypothetical protein
MMHYTTLDLINQSTMTEATYNFRLDTLIHEIDMHPHKDELLYLMMEQAFDELTTNYEE